MDASKRDGAGAGLPSPGRELLSGAEGRDLDWISGVLSDRTRRAIFSFVKRSRSAVTVNQVAEAFGMHRNAAKFHLDKLLDAGLLRAEFRRVNGRRGPGAGRPSKLYSATGLEVSFSIPERRYELLAELLLRALTSGESLEAVGEAFGRQMAEEIIRSEAPCVSGGLDCVRVVLEQLGFEPEVEVEPDGTTWITTRNCPFGRVALEAPDGEVCRLDRAIVRGVLTAFTGQPVEVREHMAMPHGHELCVREIVS